MIAVFKILTSKENASDEAFSLLVLYQLGSWMGVRTGCKEKRDPKYYTS